MAEEKTSSSAEAGASGSTQLKRVMGPGLLLFFVIGDILGTTIYSLSGKVAGEVGGALWLPFLLAFIVALLTACSYLELVGKFPRAAGAALYINRAFKMPFLTFVIAFAVMCSGITSAASGAQAFSGDYLQEFVNVPSLLVAIGFVVAVALINFWGVNQSLKANVVMTCVILAGLLAVVVAGALAFSKGIGEPQRLMEFNAEEGAFFGVSSATALAFFAMIGFEDTVNMAEETRNPTKTFPKALLWGLVITGAIYFLVAIASSMLVPSGELADSTAPLLLVIKEGMPAFPPIILSAIALFAVANTALINMMMASRLLYGMANEKIIPNQFAAIHRGRQTPWFAIVFTTLIAVVLVSTLEIEELGNATSLLLLIVFTIVNIAVLVLRREPVQHQHFRAPTFIPVIGAVFCGFLASPFSGRDAKEYLVVGILLALGVVFWFVNRAIIGRPIEVNPERFDA